MPKDIFLLGLLDWQRGELETVDHAEQYRFHSLLSYEEVVEEPLGFDELLKRARKQLDDFQGQPAAIISHWDFPSSCLAPLLSAEYGLRAPSLESVLRCEHKYWARLEQQKAIPECIPKFQAVDPFDPQAVDSFNMEFPVWLKPIKGYSSMLGFYLEDRRQLKEALEQMREHIGELGAPFNECLKHASLPPEVEGFDGCHAIAESIMTGEQFAPEGFVCNGEMHIYGFFDMIRGQGGKDILALRYPAELPESLRLHSEDVCERILKQIGFDYGCFNVEFLWDASSNKVCLIEVNTRMSQSHSDLFVKVNGMSDHEVAISVALGQKPHLPGKDGGRYKMAADFWLKKNGDAEVTRVPRPDELEALSQELGDAVVVIGAEEGKRLSDLSEQAQYSYTVGKAWIGGDSEEDIKKKYHNLIHRLPIQFSDNGMLNDMAEKRW